MKNIISIIFLMIICVARGNAMTIDESVNGQQPKAWSYFIGADWRFGVRGVSVDENGVAKLTRFDTANKATASGAGILEAREGTYDAQAAENVRAAFCDPSSQAGRGLDVRSTDNPQVLFSASCRRGEAIERVQGSIGMLPQNLFDVFGKNVTVLENEIERHGSRRLWINASVVNVERQKDAFRVTIRMVNSGRETFSFKRPDLWSGGFREETLSIGAINLDPKEDGGWEFELAGQPLENTTDFKEETITLVGGAHQDFIFKVMPKDQNKAGTYAFALDAWLYIDWKDGGEKQRSHVDFYSGDANRTKIKMDHDYPSTPEEREQWEKTHRENMSQWPVKPGQTFAEDGLYRPVRTSGNYRGLLLKPFKAGDVATTDPVTMPMDSKHADGTNIKGPVQWVWEASAPTPVKQWSFDMIEDTVQFCEPGVACPRSGRWVPRVSVGYSMEHQYQLANMVTLRRGDTMPSIKGDFPKWEWVGVAHG